MRAAPTGFSNIRSIDTVTVQTVINSLVFVESVRGTLSIYSPEQEAKGIRPIFPVSSVAGRISDRHNSP